MCDDSCILEKAEYSFIKHKSYIHYRKARIESIKAIHGGIEKGVLIPHHIFEEDCFKRVCEGFMKSNQLPWKLKQAWKKWK